jgi:hypothetical protein
MPVYRCIRYRRQKKEIIKTLREEPCGKTEFGLQTADRHRIIFETTVQQWVKIGYPITSDDLAKAIARGLAGSVFERKQKGHGPLRLNIKQGQKKYVRSKRTK